MNEKHYAILLLLPNGKQKCYFLHLGLHEENSKPEEEEEEEEEEEDEEEEKEKTSIKTGYSKAYWLTL